MKIVSLLASILAGAFASAAEFRAIEIHTTGPVAIVTAAVACVEVVNPEGEEESRSLFYRLPNLAEVKELRSQGFTTERLLGGLKCRENGGLTYVRVVSFTKNSEIHKEVMKAGGYKQAKIAFYNFDRLHQHFIGSLGQALDDLK